MTRLLLLDGDAIGPELVAATKTVLEAADRRFQLGLKFETALIGFGALDAQGTVLSQTFGIFRLLADFATWFSNKQATGCIGCRLISREPIILRA
jgi:hypothetical protein